MMRDMEVIKGKENDVRREKEMFAKEMRMSQERYGIIQSVKLRWHQGNTNRSCYAQMLRPKRERKK